MILIHHLRNSRSQRVVWLLEELGLPYEIVQHQRGSKASLIKSLLLIHPLGKVPVLCDGNVTIAETGAILEYINEAYGNGSLEPVRGTEARVQYLYWKNFAEGSFMPYLAMHLVFAGIVNESPFIVRPIVRLIFRVVNLQYLNPNINLELRYVEEHLKKNTWFAGKEFSVADIFMGFMLEAVAGRMARVSSYPYINDYVVRIRSRAAYQRAIQRGNWSVTDHDKYWSILSN